MTLKWLSSYAPVDEEFDKVSLLLHGDGTNGSTTIADSSSIPKAVTAVGNAQISTAQSKFGGSSLAFDGSGDYLTSAANAAFDYAAGDFTIEGWFNSANISLLQTVIGQAPWDGLHVDGYVIRILNSKLGLVYYNNSAAPLFILGDVTTLSSNVWYYFAATREGNVLRLFVNGILEDSVTNSISFATGKSLYGGRWEGFNNRDFSGYIDDLRITKGVARYTANFTPPTAPFPDLSPNGRITIEDNSLDVDARQYIINVEEQDGQPLESGVRTAINDFVVGCKSDGIWDAIKASCILAGARTLDGALVPLVGGAPTNFNFVSGDYNRETGLKGDGSTNYLDTGLISPPQDNIHIVLYTNTASSGMLCGAEPPRNSIYAFTTIRVPLQTSAIPSTGVSVSLTGFVGAKRDPSNIGNIDWDVFGSTGSIADASSVPSAGRSFYVFARNNGSATDFSSTRMSFYSIGEAIDLALFNTRVSNLMTAIGAAIP